MFNLDTSDAADTLRSLPSMSDATSIYDVGDTTARYYVGHIGRIASRRRRQIRETSQNIARLHEAIVAGWDIGPELAYEERRLAALEAMTCR